MFFEFGTASICFNNDFHCFNDRRQFILSIFAFIHKTKFYSSWKTEKSWNFLDGRNENLEEKRAVFSYSFLNSIEFQWKATFRFHVVWKKFSTSRTIFSSKIEAKKIFQIRRSTFLRQNWIVENFFNARTNFSNKFSAIRWRLTISTFSFRFRFVVNFLLSSMKKFHQNLFDIWNQFTLTIKSITQRWTDDSFKMFPLQFVGREFREL